MLGLGNDWADRAAAQARACGVRVLCINTGGGLRYRVLVDRGDIDRQTAHRPLFTPNDFAKLLRTFGVELPRWEACLAALHERLPRGAHLDTGAPYRR